VADLVGRALVVGVAGLAAGGGMGLGADPVRGQAGSVESGAAAVALGARAGRARDSDLRDAGSREAGGDEGDEQERRAL